MVGVSVLDAVTDVVVGVSVDDVVVVGVTVVDDVFVVAVNN